MPAVLKNAIDYLNREWNNKAAAIVSYGASTTGNRAAEHFARSWQRFRSPRFSARSGSPSFPTSRTEPTSPRPTARAQTLQSEFDQLEAWAEALKAVRVAAHV